MCIVLNDKGFKYLTGEMKETETIKSDNINANTIQGEDARFKLEQRKDEIIKATSKAGHTSENYEVFYAGYVVAHPEKKSIEVYLQSGRYHNDNLTTEQTKILESYVADAFLAQFNKSSKVQYQNVTYYPWKDDKEANSEFIRYLYGKEVYSSARNEVDRTVSNYNTDTIESSLNAFKLSEKTVSAEDQQHSTTIESEENIDDEFEKEFREAESRAKSYEENLPNEFREEVIKLTNSIKISSGALLNVVSKEESEVRVKMMQAMNGIEHRLNTTSDDLESLSKQIEELKRINAETDKINIRAIEHVKAEAEKVSESTKDEVKQKLLEGYINDLNNASKEIKEKTGAIKEWKKSAIKHLEEINTSVTQMAMEGRLTEKQEVKDHEDVTLVPDREAVEVHHEEADEKQDDYESMVAAYQALLKENSIDFKDIEISDEDQSENSDVDDDEPDDPYEQMKKQYEKAMKERKVKENSERTDEIKERIKSSASIPLENIRKETVEAHHEATDEKQNEKNEQDDEYERMKAAYEVLLNEYSMKELLVTASKENRKEPSEAQIALRERMRGLGDRRKQEQEEKKQKEKQRSQQEAKEIQDLTNQYKKAESEEKSYQEVLSKELSEEASKLTNSIKINLTALRNVDSKENIEMRDQMIQLMSVVEHGLKTTSSNPDALSNLIGSLQTINTTADHLNIRVIERLKADVENLRESSQDEVTKKLLKGYIRDLNGINNEMNEKINEIKEGISGSARRQLENMANVVSKISVEIDIEHQLEEANKLHEVIHDKDTKNHLESRIVELKAIKKEFEGLAGQVIGAEMRTAFNDSLMEIKTDISIIASEKLGAEINAMRSEIENLQDARFDTESQKYFRDCIAELNEIEGEAEKEFVQPDRTKRAELEGRISEVALGVHWIVNQKMQANIDALATQIDVLMNKAASQYTKDKVISPMIDELSKIKNELGALTGEVNEIAKRNELEARLEKLSGTINQTSELLDTVKKSFEAERVAKPISKPVVTDNPSVPVATTSNVSPDIKADMNAQPIEKNKKAMLSDEEKQRRDQSREQRKIKRDGLLKKMESLTDTKMTMDKLNKLIDERDKLLVKSRKQTIKSFHKEFDEQFKKISGNQSVEEFKSNQQHHNVQTPQLPHMLKDIAYDRETRFDHLLRGLINVCDLIVKNHDNELTKGEKNIIGTVRQACAEKEKQMNVSGKKQTKTDMEAFDEELKKLNTDLKEIINRVGAEIPKNTKIVERRLNLKTPRSH